MTHQKKNQIHHIEMCALTESFIIISDDAFDVLFSLK